eukprot:531804-Prymnesium_polylepis.1
MEALSPRAVSRPKKTHKAHAREHTNHKRERIAMRRPRGLVPSNPECEHRPIILTLPGVRWFAPSEQSQTQLSAVRVSTTSRKLSCVGSVRLPSGVEPTHRIGVVVDSAGEVHREVVQGGRRRWRRRTRARERRARERGARASSVVESIFDLDRHGDHLIMRRLRTAEGEGLEEEEAQAAQPHLA